MFTRSTVLRALAIAWALWFSLAIASVLTGCTRVVVEHDLGQTARPIGGGSEDNAASNASPSPSPSSTSTTSADAGAQGDEDASIEAAAPPSPSPLLDASTGQPHAAPEVDAATADAIASEAEAPAQPSACDSGAVQAPACVGSLAAYLDPLPSGAQVMPVDVTAPSTITVSGGYAPGYVGAPLAYELRACPNGPPISGCSVGTGEVSAVVAPGRFYVASAGGFTPLSLHVVPTAGP